MQYITKKDLVYENLKNAILEGRLEAGKKIIISKTAKKFSISEIPVREALNMLKSEGLIEFSPHVGAIVSSLSIKDIREIFEIRIELEGLATRLASAALKNETIHELQELIDQSLVSYENNDYAELEQLNYDFHLKIYKHSGNDRLYEIIKDLWNYTKRYPSAFKHNKERARNSIEEHSKILNALKSSNGILAEKILLNHKEKAVKEIIRIAKNIYSKELQEES